ncbi:MAG: hypothetical protein BMS9Abin33_0319 [Gammaproteobacteria bacterium]|nr:MAG: hypothetical protein BMS9Abin33_0319 [Gammaproteobacteria bacterium]
MLLKDIFLDRKFLLPQGEGQDEGIIKSGSYFVFTPLTLTLSLRERVFIVAPL